ncbi:hypothetical protein SFA35_15770 [Pseudomonas sp. HR96]|uniref:hypothetical protein n=1 Tax=Pseudomonas sp. HR96 TaxID=1027966 RepID=UPI002A7623C4|nr:hypothetical protein [Pseudomonas sp. HR96]WPO98106.1 hypothetical protein SFA35_15770 [Pseudomonas sp. HR96]
MTLHAPPITRQPESSVAPVDQHAIEQMSAVMAGPRLPDAVWLPQTAKPATPDAAKTRTRLWYETLKALVLPALLGLLQRAIKVGLPQVDVAALLHALAALRGEAHAAERLREAKRRAGVTLSPEMETLLDLAVEVQAAMEPGEASLIGSLLTPLRLLRNIMSLAPVAPFEPTTQSALDIALPRLIKLLELLQDHQPVEDESSVAALMRVLTPVEMAKLVLPQDLQWLPDFFSDWAQVIRRFKRLIKPGAVDYPHAAAVQLLGTGLHTSFGGLVAQTVNMRLAAVAQTLAGPHELPPQDTPHARASVTVLNLERALRTGVALPVEVRDYLTQLEAKSGSLQALRSFPAQGSLQEQLGWGLELMAEPQVGELFDLLLPHDFSRQITAPMNIAREFIDTAEVNENPAQGLQRLIGIAARSPHLSLLERALPVPLTEAISQYGYWAPLGQAMLQPYQALSDQAGAFDQVGAISRGIVGVATQTLTEAVTRRWQDGTLSAAAMPVLAMMMFYVSGTRPTSAVEAARIGAKLLLKRLPIVQAMYSFVGLVKVLWSAFADLGQLFTAWNAGTLGDGPLHGYFARILRHLADWAPGLLRLAEVLTLLPEVYRLYSHDSRQNPDGNWMQRLAQLMLDLQSSTDPLVQSYVVRLRTLVVARITGLAPEQLAGLLGPQAPGPAPEATASGSGPVAASGLSSGWFGGGSPVGRFLSLFAMVGGAQATEDDSQEVSHVYNDDLKRMAADQGSLATEHRMQASTAYMIAGAASFGVAGMFGLLAWHWSRTGQPDAIDTNTNTNTNTNTGTDGQYLIATPGHVTVPLGDEASATVADSASLLAPSHDSQSPAGTVKPDPGRLQQVIAYARKHKIKGAIGAAAAFGVLGAGLTIYGATQAYQRKRQRDEIGQVLDSPIWTFEDTTFLDEIDHRLLSEYPSGHAIYQDPVLLRTAIDKILAEPLEQWVSDEEREEAQGSQHASADPQPGTRGARIRLRRAKAGKRGGSRKSAESETVAQTMQERVEITAEVTQERIAERRRTDGLVLRAFRSLEEESFDVPMNLLNEWLYIEKLGQEILDDHRAKNPTSSLRVHFDSELTTEVQFDIWEDNADNWFSEFAPRWKVTGLTGQDKFREHIQRADDYEKKIQGVDKYTRKKTQKKSITWGKLLRGMRKHELGRNTFNEQYDDPFFKELDETDTPVRHLQELDAFYRKHEQQLQRAATLRGQHMLRDSIGTADYDPVQRLQDGHAVLYQVAIKAVPIPPRFLEDVGLSMSERRRLRAELTAPRPLMDTVEFVDETAPGGRVDEIVFLGTGVHESVASYADKQRMYVQRFASIIEIMNSLPVLIVNGRVDPRAVDAVMKYLFRNISTQNFLDADNKARGEDALYSPEYVANIRKKQAEFRAQDPGTAAGYVTVRRCDQTTLSQVLLVKTNQMKELSVANMDRATISESENFWLDVLHRVDFIGGIISASLRWVGSHPTMPPKAKMALYGTAALLQIATLTGTNIARGAIDAYDGAAQDAMVKWLYGMYEMVFDRLIKDTAKEFYARSKASEHAAKWIQIVVEKAGLKGLLLTENSMRETLGLIKAKEASFRDRAQASTATLQAFNTSPLSTYVAQDPLGTEASGQAVADRALRDRLQRQVNEDRRTDALEDQRERDYENLPANQRTAAARERRREEGKQYQAGAEQRANNQQELDAANLKVRQHDQRAQQQIVHDTEKRQQAERLADHQRREEQRALTHDRKVRGARVDDAEVAQAFLRTLQSARDLGAQPVDPTDVRGQPNESDAWQDRLRDEDAAYERAEYERRQGDTAVAKRRREVHGMITARKRDPSWDAKIDDGRRYPKNFVGMNQVQLMEARLDLQDLGSEHRVTLRELQRTEKNLQGRRAGYRVAADLTAVAGLIRDYTSARDVVMQRTQEVVSRIEVADMANSGALLEWTILGA